MIDVKHIRKEFPGGRAVDDVSLALHKSQILGLVGPSGSGKTTLLRLIAGLEKPDHGSISIEGNLTGSSTYNCPPKERRLAMVFQDLALWPHMTAVQHLDFVVSAQNHTKIEKSLKINRMLDAVKLDALDGRFPHELSGGEKQRLAIARALAQDPEYLLMDEPFSNLDAILKREMERLIVRLKTQYNVGIIYVTHDIQDLYHIADRVAVLHNGRLLQIDEKETVFKHPLNSFVRKLLEA